MFTPSLLAASSKDKKLLFPSVVYFNLSAKALRLPFWLRKSVISVSISNGVFINLCIVSLTNAGIVANFSVFLIYIFLGNDFTVLHLISLSKLFSSLYLLFSPSVLWELPSSILLPKKLSLIANVFLPVLLIVGSLFLITWTYLKSVCPNLLFLFSSNATGSNTLVEKYFSSAA